MPNSYFQFKQFIVYQDRCAMKVCTDSCILGAFAPVENRRKILDIGTGTGLLALMTAQRSKAQIDAVEIDYEAFQQAQENVLSSPWAQSIEVYHTALQDFCVESREGAYDFMLSNPPFYVDSYKSPSETRNKALQAQTLSMGDLLKCISFLLNPEGFWMVLYPPYESELLRKQAIDYGFSLIQKLSIKNLPDQAVFREIQLFSREEKTEIPKEKTLCIRNPSGTYSAEFMELLSPYYLIF